MTEEDMIREGENAARVLEENKDSKEDICCLKMTDMFDKYEYGDIIRLVAIVKERLNKALETLGLSDDFEIKVDEANDIYAVRRKD